MTDSRRTYDQVHAGLQWFYGKASGYPCLDCGDQAAHWCYQYTAGASELSSSGGAPYSENLDDYAPMCRRCHKKFDMKMDPHMRDSVRPAGRKAAAANNLRAASDPAWASERSRRIQESIRKHRDLDPEFNKRYLEMCSDRGRKAGQVGGPVSGPQRMKDLWERVSSDPGFAEHVKNSHRRGGHTSARIRRSCSTCLLVSTPCGMGNHLKHSGHSGYSEVEPLGGRTRAEDDFAEDLL